MAVWVGYAPADEAEIANGTVAIEADILIDARGPGGCWCGYCRCSASTAPATVETKDGWPLANCGGWALSGRQEELKIETLIQ
jgi:hypothetical protein